MENLPTIDIVGLPNVAVREARDRVRSATRNSGYQFPLQRVTVNLAPADLRKEGSGLDLPIAIGILAATGQCSSPELVQYVFSCELSLEGTLRPVPGVLTMAITLKRENSRVEAEEEEEEEEGPVAEPLSLIVPFENLAEARLVTGLATHSTFNLEQIVKVIDKQETLKMMLYLGLLHKTHTAESE